MLRSARLTGEVIFVTLIGLSCGLDLPHVAVLSAAFGFVLIYLLESKVTYRIDVRALPSEGTGMAADAYRALLERHGCRIIREKKDPQKGRVVLLFTMAQSRRRDELQAILDSQVDPPLKGSVDWEVD